MVAFYIFCALLIPIVYVLSMIGSWIIFTKAGREGWESLVPVHSLVTFTEMAGRPGWWIFLYSIPIANIVLYIMALNGLSKRFGRGVGFTVGLFFLPFVFKLILAFGKSEYMADEPQEETPQPQAPAARPSLRRSVAAPVAETETETETPAPAPRPSLTPRPRKTETLDMPVETEEERTTAEIPATEQDEVELLMEQRIAQRQAARAKKAATPANIWTSKMMIGIYIGVGVLLLVGIGVGIYMYTSRDKSEDVSIEQSILDEDDVYVTGVAPVETETKTETKTESAPKPEPNSIPITQSTLTFPYGKYSGDVEKGRASGMGKMLYTKRTLISKLDRRKRYAEAGQYVIGNWYNNELDFGKLYDRQGNIIESIIIGRAE